LLDKDIVPKGEGSNVESSSPLSGNETSSSKSFCRRFSCGHFPSGSRYSFKEIEEGDEGEEGCIAWSSG